MVQIRRACAQGILALAAISSTIFAIEGFFYLFPRYIPQNILLAMPLQKIIQATGNDPRRLVERFPDNPWLKFKKNVTVRDYMDKNEVETFIPEWSTDALGYKNEQSALKRRLDVIITGDSHVEGVGVAAPDTVAGVLRRKYHLAAYSMGVEGYGPQQQIGTLKKFGIPLQPKYVVYVSNGSSFTRAISLEKAIFTGRIRDRLRRDEKLPAPEGTITWQDTSVFWTAMRQVKKRWLSQNAATGDRFRGDGVFVKNQVNLLEFQKYLSENLKSYLSHEYNRTPEIKVDTKRAMEISQRTMLEGKALGDAHHFQFIVMVTPTQRYNIEMLYPDSYRKKMRGTFIEDEYNANMEILRFCRAQGIPVVDATAPVGEYMRMNFVKPHGTLIDFRRLPFFKIDGHPSQVAHEIYADSLARYLLGVGG